MNILPIAAASLGATSKATAVRASNIVNATAPEAKKPEAQPAPRVFQSTRNAGASVMTQTVDQPTNVTNEVLALNQAADQYEASASLVKASDEQHKALIEAIG